MRTEVAGIRIRFHQLRWRDLSVSLRGGGQPMPKPLLQFEEAHRIFGVEQLRGDGGSRPVTRNFSAQIALWHSGLFAKPGDQMEIQKIRSEVPHAMQE